MISQDIEQLEKELAEIQEIEERDAEAVEKSDRPLVDEIFLSSSQKLRKDLEKQLYLAKKERAHELVSFRLFGNQMTGAIRLRSLISLVEPLNSLLEHSAWRFWDKEGDSKRIDDHFINVLDLRLSGIESGSTQLFIVGNTAPDLTGSSALEEGLRSVFSLLSAKNETFTDHIHDVGIEGCRSLARLMDIMERKDVAAELGWSAPDKRYSWDGRPAEVVRIKTILDELGDPEKSTESFEGIIQVLSIRNKIEVYRTDIEKKVNIHYHRSFADQVQELRLGEKRQFVVEKTTYPFKVTNKKKDAFSLKEILY